MKIEVIVNGILDENCYIIYNNFNECLIVDPGSDLETIEKFINIKKLNVLGILITHYHFDHIAVVDELKSLYNTSVFDYKNCGIMSLGNFEFEVSLNPGHTLECCSFIFKKDNSIFTGDFIFKGSIGNYEPENEKTMINSLKKFKEIKNNYKIFPGHYEETTVYYEIENNPFIRGI